MVRFLMFIRNGFGKHKVAFLSVFIVLIASLYFAPYAIFDTGGNGVGGGFLPTGCLPPICFNT